MEYVLVSDNCQDCQFITSAFTLLNLPFKKLELNELIDQPDALSQSIALIACKQVEICHSDKIANVVKQNGISLISFLAPKSSPDKDAPTHFLKMPFSYFELRSALCHCVNHKANIPDLVDHRYPIFEKLIGPSDKISKIKTLIKQVAESDTTVLILGQSGTGKDVVASCIHYLSKRRENPLVPINCGAIPSELMESELFGHEKGAFTGALNRRQGRFEMADKGSLFLDEIGDMPMPMQVKLLRVIQDRQIERVGGNTQIKFDVRLIAATNKNLDDMIKENRFRQDLYFRLNVFPIHMPSLAERIEDIPYLIDYHLDRIHARLGHRVIFTDNAKQILAEYSWPGNIRELENFLERMVIMYRDRVLDERDLDSVYKLKRSPEAAADTSKTIAQSADKPFNIKEYIAHVEKQMIQVALEQTGGIVSAAAEFLSLGRTTLIEKMKKYNLVSQS